MMIVKDALLRLISTPPSPPFLEPPTQCHDGCEYVLRIQKPQFSDDLPVGKQRECSLEEDDEFTISTTSLSSDEEDDDDDDFDKRVSFAEPLVTAEWTREYTAKEEISDFFYSTEETQRFRQEYRLEKKLLSDLAIDPDYLPSDSEVFSKLIDAKCQSQGRHRISRVVVLHNDKLETFFNDDEEVPQVQESDDFFDSDSFWTGSLSFF